MKYDFVILISIFVIALVNKCIDVNIDNEAHVKETHTVGYDIALSADKEHPRTKTDETGVNTIILYSCYMTGAERGIFDTPVNDLYTARSEVFVC